MSRNDVEVLPVADDPGDSSEEGIYGIDLQGDCTFCNPACARLLGYAAPDDLVGKPIHALIHHSRRDGSPYPPDGCPAYLAFRQGRVYHADDEVFWRADGTPLPVDIRSCPIFRAGQVVGAVAWFRGSGVRHREEQLRQDRECLAALAADVGITLTREGTSRQLLQGCAEALVKHLGAAFARVWTLNPRDNVLELQASAGLYTHLDGAHARVPVGKFKIGLIAQERKPHLTNQVVGDPRVGDQEWARREGMVSFAGYPLVVGDQLYGVAAMFARQPLSAVVLDGLAIVADELALGIARLASQDTLRTSETMLRTLTAAALDAVILIDSAGAVRHWNVAAERLFGWGRDEILGRPLHDTLAPPEVRAQAAQGLAHFARTGEGPAIGKVLELEVLHKDGRRFPVELSLAAIRINDEWQAVGVARDISQRRETEAALRVAKEAAEEASRAKSEFLANMSHEIRTPLNGIIGMTELSLDTELTPEQRDYLLTVKSSGDALLNVINDILDFSKIEAGKLDLEAIDLELRDCLGETLRSLATRAHQKGLELAASIPADVPEALIGDPGRLRQVVVNLVGNAIKFTDAGEVVVEVRTEARTPEEATLHFRVRDTGPGIAPEKLEAVFQPFSQADTSTTRRFGGTGLGLTISARLIALMGGRIWVESAVGKGTTFHFTVTLKTRGGPTAYARRRFPPKLEGLPVLVVDDNATNRRILEETLRGWGTQPVSADSGAAALAALRRGLAEKRPYRLLLIDVVMPGMDGFELVEAIRREPSLASVPSILLTSAGAAGDGTRCRNLNVSGFLTKPVKQADLFDSVIKALSLSSWGAGRDKGAAPGPEAGKLLLPALRILLAEDNPVNQRVALGMLRKCVQNAELASNGKEVLVALEHGSFDVVLMDVQMPEMDGFEATRRIRARERQTGGHVAIVAMTAHAMKGDRERCLEAGMDDYISKPVKAEELRAALERVQRKSAGGADQGEPPGVALELPGEGRSGRPGRGPALDPEALNRLRDLSETGDESILVAVLEAFQEDSTRRLAELHAAARVADPDALRRAAHALKGGGREIGATTAAEICQSLENLGGTHSTSGAADLIARLEAELAELQPAIERQLAKEQP